MYVKLFLAPLTVLTLTLALHAEAQQTKKVARIAFLGGSSAAAYATLTEAFRQGLREVGWVEGQNIVIEYRYADGKIDRLPDLAAELVRLDIDVIAVSGARAIRELKNATKTIPVIMTTVEDPVAQGFVASLARPAGNITGLTNIAPELSGKRLELLKESLPKMSRVAILWQSDAPGPVVTFKETEIVAKALGLQIQSLEIRGRKPDVDGTFLAATKGRADALIVLQSVLTNTHRTQIVNLAARDRLPAMYTQREYVEVGGLMSYAPSYIEIYRRAAIYVDKILKGTNPTDLPIEQPTRFEFVINLKTAKQIDLSIPPNVLAQADRVIR